jgi:two-component system, NtrC family, response regulator HydG
MNAVRHRIPRILIIDDVCGRTLSSGRNADRAAMCRKYGLDDVSGDEKTATKKDRERPQLAEAIFLRGQVPARAALNDTVHNDLNSCLRVIEEGWNIPPGERCWSLVLLDLCFYTGKVTRKSERSRGTGMPEGRDGDDSPSGYFGLQILRAIQERWPDLPVIILSSMPRESAQKQFSSYGALGFLERNAEPELLREYLWRHGLLEDGFGRIVGRSKPLLFALRQTRRASAHRQHVLIRGPRGSGKELLARYLYDHALDHVPELSGMTSREKRAVPFVQLNCGTMDPTSNLYLSDLFGHAQSAFNAARERRGKIREADGGYLFMDEIGALAPNAQNGLHRVIEYGDFYPVGSDTLVQADVCFISATNEDIEKRAVTGGGFREDLLDRLRRGGTIVLPSLNDRKDDIPLLIDFFFERMAGHTNCRAIRPETVEALSSRDWPGSIRELEYCLANALQGPAHDVDELCPHHLQLPESAAPITSPGVPTGPAQASPQTGLSEVMTAISDFDFGCLSMNELRGRLGEVAEAADLFVAHYLEAMLEATRHPVTREVQAFVAFLAAVGVEDAADGEEKKKLKGKVYSNFVNFLQYLDLEPDSLLDQVFKQAAGQRKMNPKRQRW